MRLKKGVDQFMNHVVNCTGMLSNEYWWYFFYQKHKTAGFIVLHENYCVYRKLRIGNCV